MYYTNTLPLTLSVTLPPSMKKTAKQHSDTEEGDKETGKERMDGRKKEK
jgi:hypothetical protein